MHGNAPDPDPFRWPFFDARHAELARELGAWADAVQLPALSDPQPGRAAVDAACRQIVQALGEAGWLRLCVGTDATGGRLDSRSICLARETLARRHALLDFAFAMQGLGSGAITLAGTQAQRERYLPAVMAGLRIAAFALSEPEAGSDVGAMTCSARRDGDGYVLDGQKTWISNGGIADFYVVFARTPGSQRSKGISAFIVDADAPGLEIAQRLDVTSPHPLARLRFAQCRVPANGLLGQEGEGFKLAMRTLDVFRTSVAAAAVGFSRCALDAAVARANSRSLFGTTLGALQLTQARIAQMATRADAAALLVYRAAWMSDQGLRVTREAAMAKLEATEAAQFIVDSSVQMHGGAGVQVGSVVERLYRDVRALRIYEGATEVQQLIIGNDVLKAAADRAAKRAAAASA
ncbi:acyl-CoA dehydrogenase family protein [Bordetella genomosp. 13]|uniref:acyl-CoA dehydrogenase family protein n=1 Tax=Bordetella genomosp. 13 TaxID=463040 RepID=UPI00119D90E7|nr:acyl-CoA dehydrogenase family protein [Bordetella genomosp. 13]